MSRLQAQVASFGSALVRPLTNATTTWTHRQGLQIQISKLDGQTGLGEASPLPDYSPDTITDCRRYLEGMTLFPEDELGLTRIKKMLSDMPAELPAARFAVESALLDLLAQDRNQSVSELLGATTATTTARCGLLDPTRAVASAQDLLERGISCGKLKVGRSWSRELVIIRELRSRLPELRLRLDANGSWSVPEALANLQELMGLDLEFVEQPVAPAKMRALLGSPVPLAADESMHTKLGRDSLAPLLDGPGLVALVLKPTLLGGLLACVDFSKWGKSHGLEGIASHCFEGAVGTAAVAELAVATSGRFAAGVDTHEALAVTPEAAVLQLDGPGIHAHSPGLGVAFPK